MNTSAIQINLRQIELCSLFQLASCVQESDGVEQLPHQIIKTMMIQESTTYKCNDYIFTRQKELEKVKLLRTIEPLDPEEEFLVDDNCRQKMCEWSYRIVDHFKGSRELVCIAQNFVDRFLDQYRW